MDEQQLRAQLTMKIDPFDHDAPAWVAVTWEDDKLDAIAGPFSTAVEALAYLDQYQQFEINQGATEPLSGAALPLRTPLQF
jgi:hypothetical protein